MEVSRAQRLWIEAGVVLLVAAGLAAAWSWTDLREWLAPQRLGEVLRPYRETWWGLFLVVGVFVVAELLLFPVLVLVFVCGIAFGPWLGAAYALAGSVASAIPPFFIGKWLGRQRVERWGGGLLRMLDRILRRRGIVAVFLVRKIPAPYSLINLACGACGVGLLDFVLGTFLGMVTGVVLITVLGAQFHELLADPEPGKIALAVGILLAAVGLTLAFQRVLNRRLETPP